MSRSLNSIMNEMARTESAMSFVSPRTAHKMQPLSELDAFMLLDETLTSLNKQYLEAKTQRKELVSLNGVDDAMTMMAVDMEDSAWCAMQARYIELRAKRSMMVQAQDMMRRREKQITEHETHLEQSHKQKQARDFVNYLKIMKAVKEKNKTPKIFEWLIVFLIFRDKFFIQDANQKTYNSILPMAV